MAKRKVFDDFDPAPPGPSVSETLRSTRMAHGYDLRDVAAMLRIRYPYLLAIEEGRFDELPGSTYAIGFLRSYAECLGLDPDAVVTRYKDEAAGTVRRQELYLPTPAAEGGRASGGTLLLGTLVLAGIVYGGWYYLSATDRTVTDLVPTLPDRLVSLLDGVPSKPAAPAPEQTGTAAQPGAEPSVPTPAIASAQTAPAAQPPAAAPAAPAPAAGAPAPGAAAPGAGAKPPQGTAPTASTPAASTPAASTPAASTVAGKPPAVAAVPPAVLPPAQSPLPSANAPSTNQAAGQAPAQAVVNVPAPPPEDDEEASPQDPTPLNAAANPPAAPAAPTATVPANGKVYGTLNTNARLVLKATQDSWLQVRDGSDIVFTRVLKPGDTFRVPDKPNVKIRTGNAGGLVVMADGGESPPLGSVGQVLRDVAIDAHGVVRR